MLKIAEHMFPRPKSCLKSVAVVETKIRQRRHADADATTPPPSSSSPPTTATSAATKNGTSAVSLGGSTSARRLETMLLSKRSNSLQNLSNIRCKERKLDRRRPVTLAWVHRAYSQEDGNNYTNRSVAANADERPHDEPIEWRSSSRNTCSNARQEQQKRKSLDIFLARSFVDPVDVLPASGDVTGRPQAGVKTFATTTARKPLFDSRSRSFESMVVCDKAAANSAAADAAAPNAAVDTTENHLSDDVSWPPANQTVLEAAATIVSSRAEKRVTFGGDVFFEPTKLSAETRRLNFRNSHSNYPKASCNSTGDPCSIQNSVSHLSTRSPETFVLGNQLSKGTASLLGIATQNGDDVEKEQNAGLSPTAGSPVESSTTAAVTASKLLSTFSFSSSLSPSSSSSTAKRKLKSCRSRSFHKSFDNGSSIETGETTYSFVKTAKTNPVDVVTAVSLLTSNEEMEAEVGTTSIANNGESQSLIIGRQQTAISTVNAGGGGGGAAAAAAAAASSSSAAAVAAKAHSENHVRPQIREIRTKSGILKVKPLLNKSISLLGPVPVKLIQFSNEVNLRSTLDQPTLQNDRLGSKKVTVDTSNHVEVEKSNFSTSFEINSCSTQSQKERECWSSFHKMTNKGLFVSFDTILRGLLTPTEYRLRKHELLKQD